MIRQYAEDLETLEKLKKDYWNKMAVTQKLCLTLGINSYRNEIATLDEGLKWIYEIKNMSEEDKRLQGFSSLIQVK